MKAIYLHLHNKPPFVYFVFYSLVKAIYNEANERLKTLQASPPPPPLCTSAAVNIRPLPIFF